MNSKFGVLPHTFIVPFPMYDFEKFAHQLMCRSARYVFFTDHENRLTMVSDPARSYFDDLQHELEGKSAVECIKDDRLSKALTDAQTSFRSGQIPFQTSTPWEDNAEPSMLRFQGNQVVDDDGSLLGFAYEFTIESSSRCVGFEETMLSNLMRNSQDMIYFKDLNSRFIRVSDSMVQQLAADSVDEIPGKSDFDFFDSKCAEGFYADEQEVIRTKKPVVSKAERTERSGGETSWVLTSKMPLLDKNNNVVGTYGISKDITDQKETELELEHSNKKLLDASRHAGMAEIATNVIHNVGNVLNSINVSIEQTSQIAQQLKIDDLHKVALMISEHADDPKFFTEDEKGSRIAGYLSLIADQLKKDRQEIESELEASKGHLEHIKMTVSMQQEYASASSVVEEFDVTEILEHAVRMSSGSLERHKINLVRDFEPGISLMLDKHRVMQILVNLIRNAKHAMQDMEAGSRKLTISVKQAEPGFAEIAIIDTGIGIAEENLVKLFNYGFTTKRHGHGFGLHSGANSAKELGGSLQATSDGPGKGATFTLKLPQAACEDQPTSTTPILHGEMESSVFGAPSQTA